MLAGNKKILALSGGVGGAKLALGFSKVLSPDQLLIMANTADDFEHLGLSICPDLDTLMYTLAGLNNQQLGWGLADESWQAMDALERLGGDCWFRLGDRDLATHIQRSQMLRDGKTLSEVSADLCARLGVAHVILPMSDDPVRTYVTSSEGELAFQQYFVREQCRPAISAVQFKGIDNASPQPQVMQALAAGEVAAIVICPSNPFVSVAPILQLPGLRQAITDAAVPVVAVSPIVAGLAIKGPAAKMMTELNIPSTAAAVAGYYGDLLSGFVIDDSDAELQDQITTESCRVLTVPTLMSSLQDRVTLAENVLGFIEQL